MLSFVSVKMIPNIKAPYTFLLLVYQNVITCLTLSVSYILFAKIFQQKRLRIIDFFGTVVFSRLPFLIYLMFLLLVQVAIPDFIANPMAHFHPSWIVAIASLVNILLALWQIAIYFYALKESSGLTGNKLWISAIGSFVIATAISAKPTMFFV